MSGFDHSGYTAMVFIQTVLTFTGENLLWFIYKLGPHETNKVIYVSQSVRMEGPV